MAVFENVAASLEKRIRETPGNPAILVPDPLDPRQARLQLDYAGLGAEVAHWRRVLRDSGVRKGTRVLIMVRMGLPLIALNFALLGMGAVPVVIDPGMGLRAFLHSVRRTGPEALVGIPFAHRIAGLFRKSFQTVTIRVVVRDRDRDREGRQESVEENLATPGPDDPAAVLFTSGSTGAAKGVVYTHGMFSAQVDLVRNTYGIEPGEVDFPMLPIFSLFDPALGMTTVVPPMNPSRPAKADPEKVLAAMREWKVTNSFGSPVLWGNLVRAAKKSGVGLPDLRRVLIAGAPVAERVLKGLSTVAPAARIDTPYGATECLPVATISANRILSETAAKTAQGAGTCVGRAVAGVSIRVVRPQEGSVERLETFETCDPGEVGEIVVTGPTVTREYDGLPEATAAAKTRDSSGRVWHRMGDLGYIDAAGDLWFCGRKAERLTDREGKVLDTDRFEAIFNRIEGVYRTALVEDREGVVSIAVELEAEGEPRRTSRGGMVARIRECVGAYPEWLGGIERLYFAKTFPVDVRHNAKIHRRTLGKQVKRPIKLG